MVGVLSRMTDPQATELTSIYRLKVEGRLNESWSDWFDGLNIEFGLETGDKAVTTLTGALPDQCALHGVLKKIGDMGLRLLLVELVDEPAVGQQLVQK